MAQERKTIDFTSDVVDRKLCSITMDVEVAENIVADEIESVFNQIQRRTKIDGFRHGKVPMNVIKQKFAEEAKNRAMENIIRKTVLGALEKESFNFMDFPVVEELNYELGHALKYRFTSECHPKIDVKDYKGIPVTKEAFKVTDRSLKQNLDALRKNNARLVPSKSEKVTNKSFVLVDYDAFDADGKAVSEVAAKGRMLDLSSKSTLKGFKDALIGANIGDEKGVKIEYAADHPNKALAGKIITFKTKVVEIKEEELPKLNDDFAKDMETENLEDLKLKVKEDMEAEEKRRQDMEVEKQIIGYLLEKNKFEVPASLVENQKKFLVERMKEHMQNVGFSKDLIEEQSELKDAKLKERAEKDVRLSYILNAICVNENLTVSSADIEAEKDKMKASSLEGKNEVGKYFIEEKKDIIVSLKEQKLLGFLLENAKIKVEEKDMPLKKNQA
ncbi:trigger factor [Endomicrobiia bacterium]|nr:trigger factor [Endomicrobiia bacterium]